MVTINTAEVLKNFKGENLKFNAEDLTVGVAVSNILGGRVSNPTLGWILGKKFATEQAVELKAEDVVFIKKEIENNSKQEGGFFAIANGQLIEILDGKKNEKDILPKKD